MRVCTPPLYIVSIDLLAVLSLNETTKVGLIYKQLLRYGCSLYKKTYHDIIVRLDHWKWSKLKDNLHLKGSIETPYKNINLLNYATSE